jgi:hypothetical protein
MRAQAQHLVLESWMHARTLELICFFYEDQTSFKLFYVFE